MHVLFCTPAFPPFPGGGERYVRSLALRLVQAGHHVTVLTTLAHVERDLWLGTASQNVVVTEEDGLQLIRCPLKPLPGKRVALLAWRKGMVALSALPGDQSSLLMKMAKLIPPIEKMDEMLDQFPGNYDLVHGFNISWEHSLTAGWLFARQRSLPYVITPFAHFGVAGQDRVARNSTMDHQRRILREANRVLVLTAIEQEGLVDEGIPPEKIEVVGGGLDPVPTISDTAAIQHQLNLSTPYLIFVGRHSYDKGAIHAAQATLQLRQQGHLVNLVLIGQSTAEFERFYRQLGRQDKAVIRPLGLLDERKKHTLLAGATALLLPSRTDSFGIVLLEAWAHGIPVIGARAGGIPGVIDAGQDGLLVDFGDVAALAAAASQLATDPSMARRLGRRGQEKVLSQYNWDQVCSKVLESYRQTQA